MDQSIYSFKNLFTKTPIQISTAVTGIVNVLVLAGVLDWASTTVAGVNTVMALVLALFVSSQTANKAVLNEMAQEAPPQNPM